MLTKTAKPRDSTGLKCYICFDVEHNKGFVKSSAQILSPESVKSEVCTWAFMP